jgi:hypothetical protein
LPGQFCISIDLELAWGVHDVLTDEFIQLCRTHEREVVGRLLQLFDDEEIEATWAVVGHLLDEPEQGRRGAAEVWYAPEIISAIQRAKTPQEIGSHSYSHIYYGEISRNEARADLQHSRETHLRHGLPFDSFVYPRNDVAHQDLLAEAGLKVFRSIDVGWFMAAARVHPLLGRVAHLVDKMLPIAPLTVRPIRHAGGAVELPSSMLLMARNGARKLVAPSMLVQKAKLGLERAAKNGELFHLWFHPSNFYHSTDAQFDVLQRILKIAVEMRAAGDLRIMPMRAFAA